MEGHEHPLLRQLFDTMPDIMYVLSTDGCILDANPQCCRVFRQLREKLTGNKITAYIEREQVATAERVLRVIVEKRMVQRSTRTFHPTGAEPQIFEVVESPLVKDGKVWAIGGIGREITQEAVLERKLWDSVENRQWAVDFALRTALGLVKGYIYTLCKGGVTDEDRRARYGQVIEEEIDHISKIIEDMLDIRRMESGEFEINGEVVDVKECVEHVMLLCEEETRRREIQINATYSPSMNPIYLPRDAMVRIIYNLLTNAIHYTLHEGKVIIDVTDHESYVELHVKDYGVGIPDEDIPYIFEKYYRGKGGSTGQAQGTGLGLSVTRLLVEALGGKIWVCSRVGAGTDFGVVIPRQPFDFNISGETELWSLSSLKHDEVSCA